MCKIPQIHKNLILTWKLKTKHEVQCKIVKKTQKYQLPSPYKTPITPTKIMKARIPNAV